MALKLGAPPPNSTKFALNTAAINLIAGAIAVFVILLVTIDGASYETWTAIAGSTIWLKFIADFIIGWHAQPKPSKSTK